MKPIVAWIGPNRRRASPVENGGRLFCAAFRPGREVWPFGRRPPSRGGATGRAPMGFGGRLLANGSALFVVIQAAASLAAG